jgi:hypothetical protein
MKAKKSIFEHLTMFDRNEVNTEKLQHLHNILGEMFLGCCEALVKEDLDDHSFQLCVDTIHGTLTYVKFNRKKKNA